MSTARGGIDVVDNPGLGPAAMWVSTTVGLQAELADGSTLTPPWTR